MSSLLHGRVVHQLERRSLAAHEPAGSASEEQCVATWAASRGRCSRTCGQAGCHGCLAANSGMRLPMDLSNSIKVLVSLGASTSRVVPVPAVSQVKGEAIHLYSISNVHQDAPSILAAIPWVLLPLQLLSCRLILASPKIHQALNDP